MAHLWLIFVDLPIEDADFPQQTVSLPVYQGKWLK
jgi:hypothetical protein